MQTAAADAVNGHRGTEEEEEEEEGLASEELRLIDA